MVEHLGTGRPKDGNSATVSDLIRAAELAAPYDAAAAGHLLGRAVSLLGADDPRRERLERRLPALLSWGGRPRRAESVVRKLLQDADPGDSDPWLTLELAESLGMQDRWEEAVSVLRSLVEAESTDHPASVRARANLARALAYCRELDTARSTAEEALSWSAARGDAIAQYGAKEALFACLFFEGRVGEAITQAEEMSLLVQGSGDYELIWRNPSLLEGIALSAAGRIEEAAVALSQARDSSESTGALWAVPTIHCYLSLLLYRKGEWQAAATECETALRWCESSEATWDLATLLAHYAVIQARRGALSNAQRLIERFDGLGSSTHGDRAWRTLAVALMAEAEGSRREAFRELRAFWLETLQLKASFTVIAMAPDLLRLTMDANDVALGEQIIEYTGWLYGRDPSSDILSAISAHARGVTYGEPAELEAAVEMYRKAAHMPHEALAWEELAVAQSKSGHPRKAQTALRECLKLLHAMGAAGDERRVRARLRRRDVVAPPPAIDATGDGKWGSLTKTEKVVAELVAEGLRNRQIADRLFLSVQTVQTHLKSIFRKLGTTSRSQVVREVLRLQERGVALGDDVSRSEVRDTRGP